MNIEKRDDVMKIEPGEIPVQTSDESSAPFQLVLETETLACWLAINNSFTKPPGFGDGFDKWYWNGVLIQPGEFKDFRTNGDLHPFESIEIKTPSTTVATLKPDDFVRPEGSWINVVARTQRTEEPMEVDHMTALRIANFDEEPVSETGTETEGEEPTAPTAPENIRSLHNFLSPFAGGITLWAENGYDVKVTESDHEDFHRQFTFELGKDSKVEVSLYKNGTQVMDRRTDVSEIRVNYATGLPGGVNQNPPQKP